MTTQPAKLIGQRVKRREDPRLITGSSTYIDDIRLVDMLYMAILRSPYAHARIRRIDTSRAMQQPGVVAVFTGEDIMQVCAPLPMAHRIPQMVNTPKLYPLAVEKVRYAGEAVVAVVATDRYAARDALDAIDVEYEELPVVIDVEKALEPGAPIIHEEFGTNTAFTWNLGGGDVDEAFRQADVTVSARMLNQRIIPNPMETRGVVAQYQANNLTVWTSTQIPHIIRTLLSIVLSLPEHRVRVIAPEVGGGFGSKLNFYPEEALVAAVAMRLGKPIKWVEERRENFLATTHGRDQVGYVEAAAKRDGTITGLRIRILGDMGAYHELLTPLNPTVSSFMMTGAYNIPNLQAEVIGVFTNKTPTGTYRGAGRPEATYYVERIVDLVAKELNMDPVDVRRRNFVPPDRFPYTTATGLTYDSGNYELTLNRCLEIVDYQRFRQEQEQARAQGRFIGIGFSTYVEICGLAPSSVATSLYSAGGWESATVRVEPTGKVTVLTGASPHGQGEETSFAQIAAEQLGVDIDDVVVLHGDTAIVQYGIGTFGSRALAVGGAAVVGSIDKVKAKAIRIAAHMLGANPQDMVYDNGRIYSRGNPDKSVTIQEVAQAAYQAASLPVEEEPGLEATHFFEPSNFTYPFGAHACIVEVDPATGETKIRRYVAVDDCGKVINPMLVEGQVIGGIIQGLGQALLEGAVYDENGQLVTGSFMDYALPTSTEFPNLELDRTETPSPVNALGAKGVGEAGTIASTPAVVNAVVDALSPLGIKHIDMPLWSERVWWAIQNARQG